MKNEFGARAIWSAMICLKEDLVRFMKVVVSIFFATRIVRGAAAGLALRAFAIGVRAQSGASRPGSEISGAGGRVNDVSD
jgi:hypothetical protein